MLNLTQVVLRLGEFDCPVIRFSYPQGVNMPYYKSVLICILLSLFSQVSFAYTDAPESAPETIKTEIYSLKEKYIPDSRLNFFSFKTDGSLYSIETSSKELYNSLLDLAKLYPKEKVSVRLLPDESKSPSKWRALVKFSTIQIQTGPDFASEWSTQALMGTPVRILKPAQGYWALIQNYDGYVGYTTVGNLQPLTEDEYLHWLAATRVIYLENHGFIYSHPDLDSPTISDLVAGNVLVWVNQESANSFRRVQTPDGRCGWVLEKETQEWNDWVSSRDLTADNLISSARRLMGVPYIWGGTSSKGVDCSGLVNFAFMQNGYNILRDVSQIQREGVEVDLSQGWGNFQPGDLLIFGKRETNGKTHWRHVGIYLGDGRFIHSATYVHESSLDPLSPDYDEGNAKELIKVIRMINAPHTPYFHPISENKAFQNAF